MSNQANLVVTGAGGHLGRRVVELLLEAGVSHIIATTRHPEKLADLAQRGVTVRYANFDEAESLTTAFAGADRLLLVSTDALGVRQAQHLAAIQAAEAVGVQHIIYTSLIAADDTPVTLAVDHTVTEAALHASAMGYTILRNNLYAENLIASLGQAQALGGNLYSATDDAKVAYVTREDCARVASAALASDFVGRRTLDVTGSEALSLSEVAQIASSLSPQTITHIALPLEVLKENLLKAGLPLFVAELIASFDAATAQGKHSPVTTTIEDLTGRKPIRLADFLTEQLQAVR